MQSLLEAYTVPSFLSWHSVQVTPQAAAFGVTAAWVGSDSEASCVVVAAVGNCYVASDSEGSPLGVWGSLALAQSACRGAYLVGTLDYLDSKPSESHVAALDSLIVAPSA
jgi:hypothetical protein